MKIALLLSTISLFPQLASASCELTAEGRSGFRELSFEGCGYDFCVRYTEKSGRSGYERLRPSGCGTSICYSVSPSFTHVFSTEAGNGSQYLGDRSGKHVYLICNYPR